MWRQTTQFSQPEDWIFASPRNLRGSPGPTIRSGTCTRRPPQWLDSVGTPVGVQQKLMRHADIRATMNVYGDAATDEMTEAHSKVVGLALNGARTERKAS